MKVIFAGGRDFNDSEIALKVVLNAYYKKFIPEYSELTCVSGEALGADTCFKLLLKEIGCNIEEYPADWNNLLEDKQNPVKIKINGYGKKYNVLAGFNRNNKMATVADKLIAVFNGSKGTSNMIDQMTRLGKPILVFNYSGNLIKEVL